MITFEPYTIGHISVLQDGEDVGLLVGTLSGDDVEYVFEPDGVVGDRLRAAALRQIADKLDELNGASND